MIVALLCATAFLASAAAGQEQAVATGWTGPSGGSYKARIERGLAHGGRSSLVLESTGAGGGGGAVRQRMKADLYRGKRVRLAGWIQTDKADQGGALWLRVDMTNGDYVLDNVLDASSKDASGNPIKGWRRLEAVADIPADAAGISFGLRMRGGGQVRADDLSLTEVPKSVRTTTIERRPYRSTGDKKAAVQAMLSEYANAPTRPVNLGFESQ